MNNYSVNTYKFCTHDDTISYIHFHIKSNQGISSIDPTKALCISCIEGNVAHYECSNENDEFNQA
jgi:catalase